MMLRINLIAHHLKQHLPLSPLYSPHQALAGLRSNLSASGFQEISHF